jgi:hypothetical protein
MKYGFVYRWYDSYRDMYYIGCHWGYENDSYICSSDRMRKAYQRRPQDFKREILISNINDRKKLLIEEEKWLSLIKDEELGVKYYNLRNCEFNHWSSNNEILLTSSEKISKKRTEFYSNYENRELTSQQLKDYYRNNPDKLEEMREREKANGNDPERNKLISEKTKEVMAKPEIREKYLEAQKNKDKSFINNETFKNTRQGGKKNKGRKHEGQALENMRNSWKNKNFSEESKQIMRDNGKEAGKRLCARKEICSKCGFIGTPLNIGRYHNEKCRQIDWKAIEIEYKEGNISIRKIAFKYDIDHKTISKRAIKENWK